MSYELTYKPFGERSVLIEWPAIIDKDILLDILAFQTKITNNNIKHIVNINNAYNSLLISYSEKKSDFSKEVSILKNIYVSCFKIKKTIRQLWKIPVCYEPVFGIDLKEVALEKKLTQSQIIERHFHGHYRVYFIGFLPGFLYLGGLDETLQMPRKETPRLKVEKGAVAIGGNQTGVYPDESPGGWNIIGNSPILFFDITKENPCFAKAGDVIKFYKISKSEYSHIKILADAGVYQLESEVIHD